MNRNLAVVNRRGGEKEASRRSDTPTERTVQVHQGIPALSREDSSSPLLGFHAAFCRMNDAISSLLYRAVPGSISECQPTSRSPSGRGRMHLGHASPGRSRDWRSPSRGRAELPSASTRSASRRYAGLGVANGLLQPSTRPGAFQRRNSRRLEGLMTWHDCDLQMVG